MSAHVSPCQISTLRRVAKSEKTNPFHSYQILLALLLGLTISLNPIEVQAQNKFFNPVALADSQLTQNQLKILNAIRDLDTLYSDVQLVTLDSFLSNYNDGVLTFNIPWSDSTYNAYAKYVEIPDDSTFVWSGIIPDYRGSVSVVWEGDKIFGQITADTFPMDLFDLTDGLHALALVDIHQSGNLACAGPDTTQQAPEFHEGGSIESGSGCQISVLVLYTPAARNGSPDIWAAARNAINKTNQAYRNSNILQSKRLVLAGIGLYNFTETDDIKTDLFTLANDQDVQDLRDLIGADVVVLLTLNHHEYRTLGVAFLDPTPNSAFAICDATLGLMEGASAFPHEVGHIQNAHHQQCAIFPRNCSDHPGYNHAYLFETGLGFWPFKKKDRTTIMFGIDSIDLNIPYFSTPDVQYKGKAVGTAADNDNARMISERFCTVAAFRSDNRLKASIIGPSSAYQNDYISFEADPVGGDLPYTYAWRSSTDGFTYSQVLSTTSTLNLIMPQGLRMGLFVRLDVESDDQQNSTYIHTVVDAGNPIVRLNTAPPPKEPESQSLKIYPNPSNGFLNLQFNKPLQANATMVNILDLTGRIIQSEVFAITGHDQVLQMQVSPNISSGLYLVQVVNGISRHSALVSINP